MSRRIAVVGGGITGLAAAHALGLTGGTEVVVHEAGDRLGGKIRTTPFAGNPAIDEGADAFLRRVPWATTLASAVGLDYQLVAPASGSASVWWDGLHPIPEGLLLGMPTDVLALARSRLLPIGAKLRAALEPFLPRTSTTADSLGAYVRARFGDAIHERLVDPLVGSIYAADTDRFSLAAVPQIAELAARARSVLLAARPRAPVPPGPVFSQPLGGMGAFVSALADALATIGVDVRLGAPAGELAADGTLWRVDGEAFDAVVLACPPAVASKLLAPVAADAASALATIDTADVALVTVALPGGSLPPHVAGQSGYLVPKPVQRMVTAVSFGSQKWAHWALPEDRQLLRISLGRDGLPVLHHSDEELIAAAVDEVGGHLGVSLQPEQVRVSRWPGAFPQYRPHHAELVAGATATLPSGVAIAGAGYHGIGIPACIRSGQVAADAVR